MTTATKYSIDELKNEARYLVKKGAIDRHQPICTLWEFIPPREWVCVEWELEDHDYTLRDRICDLLSQDEWQED